MKKTLKPILVILPLLIFGLFFSNAIKAETYQKTETGHVLFYSPDDWQINQNKNYNGAIGKYTGNPLINTLSPNWIPPYPDNGEVSVEFIQYKSGGDSLNTWFKKYWKISYKNSEKPYTQKKYKGKRVFTNNNIHKIYLKDQNPDEGKPFIQKKLFVKRKNRIYEISLLHVGLEKDENWKKANDIIKSTSFY